MATALLVFSIVTFLILVNALYVAAEFSAVSVRRSRIQELANEGNRLARLVLPAVQNASELDRYVATCQIGITLSSLVLGAYGQATLAVALAPLLSGWGWLQPAAAESTAAALVLVVLTVLQVILGELVPKSMALQNPTGVALFTVLPMRWSIWIFRWFIAVLNGSGVRVLKWFGMAAAEGHRHVHSPDELELLIAESRDGGLLEPGEQQRLHQALRLGLRTARQLMVPRTSIAAIDVAWSAERVLEMTLETPFSRLPVYEGSIDNVLGILHTRDLVLARVQHRSGSVRDLIRPAAIVPETMAADQLLRFLREQRTHQALVIDEFGGLAGLVTLEDVLSELLGEVGDEFQPVPGGPERLPDGRIRVPGHLPLAEARRWAGTVWESEADTIGGHVMQVLGRMAVEGDQITIDGILIEVERLAGRVPGTVLVTPRRPRTDRQDG